MTSQHSSQQASRPEAPLGVLTSRELYALMDEELYDGMARDRAFEEDRERDDYLWNQP